MIKKCIARARRVIRWMEAHHRQLLAAMLGVQALTFVIILAAAGAVSRSDTLSYTMPAESLLQEGRMLENAEPSVFRTPGYPVFLAIVYALTGGSNLAAAILQSALCVLSTWLIFRGIDMLSKGRSRIFALTACLFFILDPSVYTYGVSIMSDAPHMAAVLASLYFWILYQDGRKLRNGVFAAAALCAALTIRPISMYLCFILAAAAAAMAVFRKLPKGLAVFAVCAILLTYFGWCARNLYVHEMFTYSPVRSYNMLYYDGAATRQLVEGVNRSTSVSLMEADLFRVYPNYDSLGRKAQFAAMHKVGSTYLKEHLGSYLLLNIKGLFAMMLGAGVNDLPLPRLADLLLSCFFSGILLLSYLFYAAGFLANIRRQKAIDWLILLSVMYFMAASASVGYDRFRVAYYPIMLIGAGACWRNHKGKADDPQQRCCAE